MRLRKSAGNNMQGLEYQAEELYRCPDNPGELWKDLEQGKVMIGVRTQDPLGFQVEDESEMGRVKLGAQQGQTLQDPVTKCLLATQ